MTPLFLTKKRYLIPLATVGALMSAIWFGVVVPKLSCHLLTWNFYQEACQK